MTTAGERAAPGRESAETYLRLQAEAELRRALTFPQYQPPRQRGRPASFRNVVVMRRRRAAVRRAMRSSEEDRGRASKLLAGRAGTALTQSAGSAGKALAAVSSRARGPIWRAQRRFGRLRRSLGRRYPRPHESPRAQECLDRMAELGAALVSAGALDEATEQAVYSDFQSSLAARSRIEPAELLSGSWLGWPPMSAGSAAAAGPLSAVPVGVLAEREVDGQPVRLYLGTLVLDQNSASLTMQARYPAALEERAGPGRPPLMDALDACTATDDGGASYWCGFSGGGGGAGSWDGMFGLRPVPPASCRWLDFTLPGADPVRLRLDTAPAACRVTTTRLSVDETADRFVDSQTVGLLQEWWAGEDDTRDEPGFFRVAASLLEAGVLSPASPSLGRLAAAARRLGLDLPAPLAAVEPGTLAADWLSLLARSDSDDGPAGVMPVAAVLPEVDGARCIITGLLSEPGSATLQFHARGWPDAHHPWQRRSEAFRWTARDDVHGWYVGTEAGGSWGNDVADMAIRLHPAINPRARELQVVLTGRTAEVTVTVPLNWREGV